MTESGLNSGWNDGVKRKTFDSRIKGRKKPVKITREDIQKAMEKYDGEITHLPTLFDDDRFTDTDALLRRGVEV